MKTNHQRGFVAPGDIYGYMKSGGRWFTVRSYIKGVPAISGGEPGYDGHRGFARMRKGAKRRIHSRERQRLKRFDMDT